MLPKRHTLHSNTFSKKKSSCCSRLGRLRIFRTFLQTQHEPLGKPHVAAEVLLFLARVRTPPGKNTSIFPKSWPIKFRVLLQRHPHLHAPFFGPKFQVHLCFGRHHLLRFSLEQLPPLRLRTCFIGTKVSSSIKRWEAAPGEFGWWKIPTLLPSLSLCLGTPGFCF